MAKILVVDDQKDWRYLVKKIFEKTGHEVIEANNGSECQTRVKDERPDLVILDVMMPGADGWEVCKGLKEDPTTNSIPICVLSALSNDEDISTSLEYAHADEHLAKSISIRELREAVSILLSTGPRTNYGFLRVNG